MGSEPAIPDPTDGARRYFKQGAHDGLCGFYATLNAFRYLLEATGQYPIHDDWAFFDEAVECLARVPGVGVRILMNDHRVGGIDQYQIRDLCSILAERLDLAIDIALIGPGKKMPFARRYRALQSRGQPFVLIVAHRDGSHWTVVTGYERHAYCLIDDGLCRSIPIKNDERRQFASDSAVVLTIGHRDMEAGKRE